MTKLYGHARNLHTLEPHYSAHVAAMTTEGLHAKSDIAAELAWRDAENALLRERSSSLRKENTKLRAEVARLREALEYAHQMARERMSSDLQVHLFDRLGMVEDHAAAALAATDPETRS